MTSLHLERILTIAFLIVLAIAVPLLVWTITDSVQAAPSVPVCEAISVAGPLTVYRCEPLEGPSFLINSVGFMQIEP